MALSRNSVFVKFWLLIMPFFVCVMISFIFEFINVGFPHLWISPKPPLVGVPNKVLTECPRRWWLRTHPLSEMSVEWWMNWNLSGNPCPRRSYGSLGFQSFGLRICARNGSSTGSEDAEDCPLAQQRATKRHCGQEGLADVSQACEHGHAADRHGVLHREVGEHRRWDLMGGSCPLSSLRGRPESEWRGEGEQPQKDYRGSLLLPGFLV